jgi:hypothetical protein
VKVNHEKETGMLALNIILCAIVFAGIVTLLARAIRGSANHDAAVAAPAPRAAAAPQPRASQPRAPRRSSRHLKAAGSEA